MLDLGIAGRKAIVCAASKGLGRASAEALARDGVRVAICARGGPALREAAAAIEAAGGDVLPIEADLRQAADITRVLETTVARFGGLDILVTNTGGPPSGPFMTLDERAWTEAIDSMLLSVVRLCRGAIPHLQARGGGRIINITSISVKQPIEGLVLSNSLRAAVTGLAKTLAVEQHPRELRRAGLHPHGSGRGAGERGGGARGHHARPGGTADRGQDSARQDGDAGGVRRGDRLPRVTGGVVRHRRNDSRRRRLGARTALVDVAIPVRLL